MDSRKKIKNLIKKHSYEVVVSSGKDSLKTITAYYPERKEKPFCEGFSCLYTPQKKSIFKGEDGVRIIRDGEEKFIQCPDYCVEELVYFDILKTCRLMRYSEEILCFYFDTKEAPKDKFMELALPFKLSAEKISLKESLSTIIKEASASGFNHTNDINSIKEGVSEGYSAIKQIYYEK